jgi:hypothetical protein
LQEKSSCADIAHFGFYHYDARLPLPSE